MSKILNIYINGTDEDNLYDPHPTTIFTSTSLANLLNELTIQSEQQSSLCIKGCGVNNPYIADLSAIFTFNLESQINDLVKQIKEKISTELNNEKLVLNLYGFSRGGAGVFWLCQKLKDIPANQIEINVCAFEPVPGNFIRAAYTDSITGLKATLSGQIADLRDCQNLNKVLVLFTNQPIPDIACHGPILPCLPEQAEITVDVLPGCHKGAELFTFSRRQNKWKSNNTESMLSFHYVSQFLISCGTEFDFQKVNLEDTLKPETNLIPYLEEKNHQVHLNHRAMHFYNEIISKQGAYLNLLHKKLVTNQNTNDYSDCSLSVKEPSPQPTYWNGLKSPNIFTTLFRPQTKRTPQPVREMKMEQAETLSPPKKRKKLQ